MIIIVMGLPGSGKSYFASRLAAAIDAIYIYSDGVRKKMIPARTYSTREKLSVYDAMLAQTQQAITLHKHIVLDGTFYKNAVRKKFIAEAGKNTSIHFIEIKASEALIHERLKQSRADSEADLKVYYIVKAQFEPLEEKHLVLESTNDNITAMLQAAIRYLRLKDDKRSN